LATCRFLSWIGGRGTELSELSQHDVDAWHARGTGTREHVQRFLYWCRAQRLTGKLDIPQRDKENPQLIGEHDRLKIIRSLLLLDDQLSLPYRVAGCLITLFGQPAGRVVTLTLADLTGFEPDDNVESSTAELRIRLGKEWIAVPEELAVLVRFHIAHRANTNTAANAQSKWLFPGQISGEHLSRMALLNTLRAAGSQFEPPATPRGNSLSEKRRPKSSLTPSASVPQRQPVTLNALAQTGPATSPRDRPSEPKCSLRIT
jgi:hypothetical protein